MSKIQNMKELDKEDDDYLNRLFYVKKQIQEQLDREMSMYFKIIEINSHYQKKYADLNYKVDFNDGYDLELDMARNLKIIEKIDAIIGDILYKIGIPPFDSHDYNLESYAEFILRNDYNINAG